MKIHILSNSLRMNSGFSIVARHVANGLKKLGHTITMTGMQTAYISEFNYGIEVLPAQTLHVDDITQTMLTINRIKPDVVLAIFQMDYEFNDFAKIYPKTAIYCPVEGKNIPQKMANDLLHIKMNGGQVVAQTKYGQGEMQLALGGIDVPYVYHGYDPDIFKPLDLDNINNIKYCYYKTENGKLESDPVLLHKQSCYDCKLNNKEQVNCPYYKEEHISILKFINGKWGEDDNIPITRLPEVTKGKFVFGFVGQNLGIRKRIERLLKSYSLFIKDSRQLKDRTIMHLHCLAPESPILTLNRGIQKIKDIKVGDRVLTHKGRFMKVSQVMKREYSGDVIRITPKKIGIPITLTPDHPVLSVKTELCSGINSREGSICSPERSCYRMSNYKKIKYCKYVAGEEPYRKYKTEWIRARDLEIGDFVVYPRVNNKVVGIEKIRIIDYIDDFLNVTGDSYDDIGTQYDLFGNPVKKKIVMNNSYSKKYCKIPSEIELTGDIMRLFGYFISDGDHSGNSIEFTFNIGEEEYVEDIKEIMKNIFGLNYSYRMREHAHVVIYPNRVLQNMFQNMFCPKEYVTKKGKGSKAKIVRIPPEFLDLPLDKLTELVKGEWRGDGTTSDSGYSITTTSETLANQLVYILSKFNILPALRIERSKNQNHEDKFHIEIYGKDVDIFGNIIGDIHPNRTKVEEKDSVYLKGKNLFYVPIRNIEIVKYEGDVWNLDVEEDNSYISMIAVHNCMPIAVNGIDLTKVIRDLGIQDNVIFSYGTFRSSAWTDQAVSILYNTFDINISASSSEGFGLPTLESMACGIPNIGPNCSSFTELIGEDPKTRRGLLASIIDWQMIQDCSIRALVNESDLSRQMKIMYQDEDLRKTFSKNCIEFSKNYTWDKICDRWDKLLKEMK